jgi:stress response protein YsnF
MGWQLASLPGRLWRKQVGERAMSGTVDGKELDTTLDVAGPVTTETQTIELLEETLRVAKRTVEHGRIRVSVLTETEQQQVRETLRSSRVEVAHVAIGRRLEAGEVMPQARTENDVLIVPIVEEMLVVEKRLVVVEEMHIRIVQSQEEVEQAVPLRRQRAVVERLAPDGDGPAT